MREFLEVTPAWSNGWVTGGRTMSSRREFVKGSALAATACLLPVSAGSNARAEGEAIAAPASSQASSWYDRPMRWAQLAFVEDDPGNYDPQFWLDYFRAVHADAACLSAGGVVAFYPTELPLQQRSPWLGDRDAFGDLLAACRKMGMNVIARTDAHACWQKVYDAHPDWIRVDASGKPVRHPSDPRYWETCALGPYNFDFMTSVHEEIMRLYKPDGIFTNRWAGSGMCYCEHCRQNFREATGLDLPRTLNPQDPARRQYILWRQQRLFALWRLWNEKIRAINPNASYIANAGGGALSDLDMKTIAELAPTMVADRQSRRGIMAPWANGKNGKEYRATMGSKAIAGMFSVGIDDEHRWKDSVQNGDEIRLWVADGIAQGLRPWFIKFNAKPIDRRWLPVVKEIFAWHYANENYLRNLRPLARVGLVYSQQSALFYGGEQAREKIEEPGLGFYQTLVEARIPFEMVHDRCLDEEHLAPFRTLILPNIAALSDAQCASLRAFVERGGGLVATYQTSLFDEWGVQRSDFGLASLFGASYAGKTQENMLNSYLNLEKDSAAGAWHPLLRGFQDAGRIINAVNQVEVTPADASQFTPLRIVRCPTPTCPWSRSSPVPAARIVPELTSTRGQRPRRLFPRRSGPHVLAGARCGSWNAVAQCRGVGNQRSSARQSGRPGHSGCGRVGAERFHDAASRQSHQSNDVEGSGTRDRSRRGTEDCVADSVRSPRPPRSSARCRARRSLSHGRRHHSSRNAIDRSA